MAVTSADGLRVDGGEHRVVAHRHQRRERQRQRHGRPRGRRQHRATPRTGTATIAGQTFTVNQAAAACTYAINPGSTQRRGGR